MITDNRKWNSAIHCALNLRRIPKVEQAHFRAKNSAIPRKLNPVGGRIIFFLFIFTYLITNYLITPCYASLSFSEKGKLTSSEYFGLGLASGDVNKDGYPDLLVANNAGYLYIYYGGVNLDTTADVTIVGTSSSFPNGSWCNLYTADFDKDGYFDILGAQARGGDATNGKQYIFWGSPNLSSSLTTSNANITFTGNDTNKKMLGYSFAPGDFNGDGFLDLAVGATTANSNTGAVHIFYGNGAKNFDTAEDKTLTVSGSSFLSYDAMAAGDINGDGYDDVITAEIHSNGEAYIFYGGANMDTTWDVKFNAESTSDEFPKNSVAVGDLNEDGFDDVCFGANKNSTPASKAGRVYCFYGSANFSGTKAVNTANIILNGSAANDNFGRAIFLYDVNNDGHLDLISGAYQTTGSKNGYVNIYLGNGTSNFDTTADVVIPASQVGESGQSFGAWPLAGDMDNDGWPDLFITSSVNTTVHIFEVDNGSPSITTNSSVVYTSDTSPDLSGSASVTGRNLGGVQWSFSNTLRVSSWASCSSSDGSFNSSSEGWSCNVHGSELKEGSHTVYTRSWDENNLYMPQNLFAKTNLVVDITNPGPFTILNPEKDQVLDSSYSYTFYPFSTFSPNTDPSRPTFRWYANSKDNEINTNGKTDEGSGIDKYSIEILKIKEQRAKIENPNKVIPNTSEVSEDFTSEVSVPETEKSLFKISDIPFNVSTPNHYFFLNDDKYTLVYEGFEDDLRDGLGTPNPYNYDNNYISLTTKSCIRDDPKNEGKKCWEDGENDGRLTANFTSEVQDKDTSEVKNTKTKYKVIIKSYDKAGNSRIEERMFYLEGGIGGIGKGGGGEEALGEKDKDIKILDIKKLREEENRLQDYQKKTIRPFSFIFPGCILLGASFLVWKRKKTNRV